MLIKKRSFYKVVTPPSYADITNVRGELITDIDQAKDALNEWGKTDPKSEHFDYWEKQRLACKIVKVTEVVETVMETINDAPVTSVLSNEMSVEMMAAAPDMLNALVTLVNWDAGEAGVEARRQAIEKAKAAILKATK